MADDTLYLAPTHKPAPSQIAAAKAAIELMRQDGETPAAWLYEVAGLPDEAEKLANLRHEQLLNLLHDVGHSWGMPETGIIQLAETIESIYGA